MARLLHGTSICWWISCWSVVYLPGTATSASAWCAHPKSWSVTPASFMLCWGISGKEQLLGHPVEGKSWESFVTETLVALAPMGTEASFYRTAAGAEIDLLLSLPSGELWAIEIKRSSAPTVEKGFHFACADLKPKRKFVVYPGNERFSVASETDAIGLRELGELLRAIP